MFLTFVLYKDGGKLSQLYKKDLKEEGVTQIYRYRSIHLRTIDNDMKKFTTFFMFGFIVSTCVRFHLEITSFHL